MRLLHTSDWHLGRSFHQVGLLGAQAAWLDHLVGVVRSESVDAVLVSGDVYDRALPSPDIDYLPAGGEIVRLDDRPGRCGRPDGVCLHQDPALFGIIPEP